MNESSPRLIASEISIHRLLDVVLQATSRVLDVERSSLWQPDRERGELYSEIAQGIQDVVLRFPITRGIAGHVARTGEIVNIADAYKRLKEFEIDELPVVDGAGRAAGMLDVQDVLEWGVAF